MAWGIECGGPSEVEAEGKSDESAEGDHHFPPRIEELPVTRLWLRWLSVRQGGLLLWWVQSACGATVCNAVGVGGDTRLGHRFSGPQAYGLHAYIHERGGVAQLFEYTFNASTPAEDPTRQCS